MLYSNKVYDNADSFSMAFDEAWRKDQTPEQIILNKNEKLERILSNIKDHPFLINSPIEARKVAEFRIRLLKLN